MLHLAAGVYDLQHLLHEENTHESTEKITTGETRTVNEGCPPATLITEANKMQEPTDTKMERERDITDGVLSPRQPKTGNDEKDDLFGGKVQLLVAMEHNHLVNSERGRSNLNETPCHSVGLHFPLECHMPQSSHHRSSSPDSQISDLNRSLTPTPSLDGSLVEMSVDLMFESENRASLKNKIPTNPQESLMTDSGIYEHEGSELAISDLENSSEVVSDYSRHKCGNAGASHPHNKSDREEVHSVSSSWFESSSDDFYISPFVNESQEPFATFDPNKQAGGVIRNSQMCKSSERDRKMVMYIETIKRRHSSDSFNTDEDELAAYIYDPQINDSYNTCPVKNVEYFTDACQVLLRLGQSGKEDQRDPLEDPDFAMPSPSSSVVIPSFYEGDEGDFFMEVMPPFGDVSSMKINYQFEMQDATWGVSSEEAYFDRLTGERILSTIYEFEVSSEEDTDSIKMADSQKEVEEEAVTAFRQDSLEEAYDEFSQDSETEYKVKVQGMTDLSHSNSPEKTDEKQWETESLVNSDDTKKEMLTKREDKTTIFPSGVLEFTEMKTDTKEGIGSSMKGIDTEDTKNTLDNDLEITHDKSKKCENDREGETRKENDSNAKCCALLEENYFESESKNMEGEDDGDDDDDEIEGISLSAEILGESDAVLSKPVFFGEEEIPNIIVTAVEDDDIDDDDDNNGAIPDSSDLDGESDIVLTESVCRAEEKTPDIIVTTVEDELDSDKEFYDKDAMVHEYDQCNNIFGNSLGYAYTCDSSRSSDDECLSVPHTEIEIISDFDGDFTSDGENESHASSDSINEYDFLNDANENDPVTDTKEAEDNLENNDDRIISISYTKLTNAQETESLEIEESKKITNSDEDISKKVESNFDKISSIKPSEVNISGIGSDVTDNIDINIGKNIKTHEVQISEIENFSSEVNTLDAAGNDPGKGEFVRLENFSHSLNTSYIEYTVDDVGRDFRSDINDRFLESSIHCHSDSTSDGKVPCKDTIFDSGDVRVIDREEDVILQNNTEASVAKLVETRGNTNVFMCNAAEVTKPHNNSTEKLHNDDEKQAIRNINEDMIENTENKNDIEHDCKYYQSQSHVDGEISMLSENDLEDKDSNISLLDNDSESLLPVNKKIHHDGNEAQEISDYVDESKAPKAAIVRPSNLCVENLIKQKYTLEEDKCVPENCNDLKERVSTLPRESPFSRSSSYIQEEYERLRIKIGSKHKLSRESEEKSTTKYRRNSESKCDDKFDSEELEMHAREKPPLRTKKVLQRRLSDEPKSRNEEHRYTLINDMPKIQTIIPCYLQAPQRPKRRKEKLLHTQTPPPRKNRSVSPGKYQLENRIENVTTEREPGDDDEVSAKEKQNRESLNDDVSGRVDSRSSSVGIEKHTDTLDKQTLGTVPKPRDPGSECLEWNINPTNQQRPDPYDARIHEYAMREAKDTSEFDTNEGMGSNYFSRPIKFSEIIASMVLDSRGFSNTKSRKPKAYNTNKDTAENESVTDLEIINNDYISGDEGRKSTEKEGTLEGPSSHIGYNLINHEIYEGHQPFIMYEGKAEPANEALAPCPPKRKKKTQSLICNTNQHPVTHSANEIPSFEGIEDKLCPPKVPARTYRRAHSLPSRPISRIGPASPSSYSLLRRDGNKAVTRSATTASCHLQNTRTDLKFSVPEVSSIVNYDPFSKSRLEARRASVTLMVAPESPGATKRHVTFQQAVVATPHVRKRHLTADSNWRKHGSLRKRNSFRRAAYNSLPRNWVRRLSSSPSKTSDTPSCFPNPFSRKQKPCGDVYMPKSALVTPPHFEVYTSSPLTPPKISADTFSALFSSNSTEDIYDREQVVNLLAKRSSIFEDDDSKDGKGISNPPPPPTKTKDKDNPALPKNGENDINGRAEGVVPEIRNNTNEEETCSEDDNKLTLKEETLMTKEDSDNTSQSSKSSTLEDTRENKEEENVDNNKTENLSHENDEEDQIIHQLDALKILETDEENILDDTCADLMKENNCESAATEQQNLDLATPLPADSSSNEEIQNPEHENKIETETSFMEINASPSDIPLSETFSTEVIELETHPCEPPVVPLQTWAERQGFQEPVFPSLNLRHQSTQTQPLTRLGNCEYAEKSTQYTPSPGPPAESEKDEEQQRQQQEQEKSAKRDDDSRVQQDRCIEVYPETVRQRQRTMMSSSNKVDIKNWASGSGNDTLTSPSKVKKFLPSVKALRNQFETGKTNNNKPEANSSAIINNGTMSRKSSSSNSSISSSTLEKTSSTNSLNSTTGSVENLMSANNEINRAITSDELVEPIYSQFKKVDEELKELMSKPPSTTGWNPRPLLKRLYYVPEAPKHHSQGTTYINIEGYLEKLPSGRKKATFWNAWKRRYFVAKDGILYYYQNPQAEKASMKMTLMGGKVECMEPNMVGVDDGSRDSKAGAMIGIDDGKGHYVVVRCSSRQEAERWKRALETHTVEDFASQYVQPWPVPTNPALLRDTLVIDLGSSSVRAGVLATQATLPQVFLPSVVATERESRRQIWGFDALSPDIRSVSSITFPIRPSHKISKYSVDLSAVSSLLQKAFADLKVDPKNYNIQLSVPRILNPNTQTELLRILFDKFGVKSVNLTHQSILALYAYNATSGIVVDIGERIDIVPVIDGYIVDGGVSRVPYGGYRILDHLRQFLYMRNISLINEVESYIIRYVLENICYCAHHYNTEKARCTNNLDNFDKGVSLAEFFQGKDSPFEYISLDFGRFQATEGLFNPDAWGLDHPGIHKLVHKAIMECSMDIRKEMSRSIFLAGGVTQLPGLVDRLTTEIDNLTPPAIRPKVHASPYRYHAAYIGACVLAESPAFTQSRISREEWNKQGSSALRKWSL